MSTVYLAEDLKHERKVAMKVLRPELSAVIGVERFLRESKTIASLQHPHILGLSAGARLQWARLNDALAVRSRDRIRYGRVGPSPRSRPGARDCVRCSEGRHLRLRGQHGQHRLDH